MLYRKSFLFRIAFACESHVYQNVSQRAPLRLAFGNVRPAWQLILLLSICFAHWVANDNPWSTQQRKRLVAGSLGRGPCGLSLAQWHSWERWPRGQLTWRRWPRWGHFFTTPQRWEPCSHRTARGTAVCPGQLSPRLRQHVTATFLARWFCYMLNSARKISILNWRRLTAVANIEKCSFLKAFGKSSTFSI